MRLSIKISFLNPWSKIALQGGMPVKPRSLLMQTYDLWKGETNSLHTISHLSFQVIFSVSGSESSSSEYSEKLFFFSEKIDVNRLLWLLDMTTLAA